MKGVKFIVGILGLLFAGAHIVTFITDPPPSEGIFAVSGWIGKFIAILIGLIIALVCLRPRRTANDWDDTAEPDRW